MHHLIPIRFGFCMYLRPALAIRLILTCVAFVILHRSTASVAEETSTKATAAAAFELIDLNGDGRVGPFEAAAAMQFAVMDADRNGDGEVSIRETGRYLRARRRGINQGVKSIFREFDDDNDKRLSLKEIENTRIETLIEADVDQDDEISQAEVTAELKFGALTSDKSWIDDEVDAWFESDANGDGQLSLDELAEEDKSLLAEADTNGNEAIDPDELKLDVQANFCEAEFTVRKNEAEMIGTIGLMTSARVMELIVDSPQVDTIVLKRVPGSIDDTTNEIAMRLFRQHGFKTIVPADGLVASGGTDLFLSGKTRFAHPDAKIGVHAWADLEGSRADRKRKSKDHKTYLALFKELGIPESFYWYTLKIAGPDSMHWMTADERKTYHFNTKN